MMVFSCFLPGAVVHLDHEVLPGAASIYILKPSWRSCMSNTPRCVEDSAFLFGTLKIETPNSKQTKIYMPKPQRTKIETPKIQSTKAEIPETQRRKVVGVSKAQARRRKQGVSKAVTIR